MGRGARTIRSMFVALAALSGLGGGVAGVGAGGSAALGQSFHLLSDPQVTHGERVYGLSADGRTAAGENMEAPYGGFFWTRETGKRPFGYGPTIWSRAFGLSGDGTTAVGETGISGQAEYRAFRYRDGDPALEVLGVQPGYDRSTATGASGDGEVVVGYSRYGYLGDITQAFRWTRATGLVGLGFAPGHFASEGTAISRDGSTIVGHGRGGGYNGAFAWTQATGMVPLPGLDATGDGRAFGVNFDGRLIVGDSVAPLRTPVIWVDGVPTSLGVPPGFLRGSAYAVSDDGSIVVGQVDAGLQTAAIWTPARGMEVLGDYLARHGVVVPPGINLISATAVSSDGLTIAGYTGPSGQGGIHGWVATVPGPSTGLVLGLACLSLRRQRRVRK